MGSRYQVFISSTFEDLKDVRQVVIEQLIAANYLPAGMELFVASNDEQFDYIKKIIDDSDYFVLIIGSRYGTINKNAGISFTEQEFDYAVDKDIPILAFICTTPESLMCKEESVDSKQKLEIFKTKVQNGRITKDWSEKYKLSADIVTSLMLRIKETPRPGWSRGPFTDEKELLIKMDKLRDDNEHLKSEIDILKKSALCDEKYENIAGGNDEFKLHGIKILEYGDLLGTAKEIVCTLTFDEIFSSIGPYLYKIVKFKDYRTLLCKGINNAFGLKFESINDDDIQTLKLQFEALGLIQIYGGLIDEDIQITPRGKKYLQQLKVIKKPVDKVKKE